jgi:hypothetical protein
MAKNLLDGSPKLLLKPLEAYHCEGISSAPDASLSKNKIQISSCKNIDKVIQFLVAMSGQATVYDTNKRKDTLTLFSETFLKKKLRVSFEADPEERGFRLQSQINSTFATNLFFFQPSQSVVQEDLACPLFTEYTSQSFKNLDLQRQVNSYA